VNPRLRSGLGSLRAGARELWTLRWVRALAWLALVALGLRVLAVPILGFALDRLAAGRDLRVGWEDLRLELLEGRARVTRLALAPRGEGARAPLVEIDYAIFDLDLSALLWGEPRVARAEIDGLTARLERESDGTWNVERHVDVAAALALLESGAPAQQGPADEGQARQPLDLAPPLAVDALRLQEARLVLVDRALEPPLELELRLDAALSDLRAPDRPARFSATLTSRDLVDGAHVEGQATWNADTLRVEAWAHAAGLRAARLDPYLTPLDLRASGESLEARCELSLSLDVRGEARDTLGGELRVSDVALRADGREALALDALSVRLDAWSRDGAVLPSLELAGPRGRVVVERDGSVSLAGLAATGTAWEEPAGVWLTTLFPQMRELPTWAALLVRPEASAYPWRLGSLSLRDGAFDLEDHRLDPPARVPLEIARVELADIVHDPLETDRRIPLRVELAVPGVLARATLAGHLDPFAPARHVDLTLAVEGIDPAGLDGYLRRLGLERDLRDGRFELALQGAAHTDPSGRTEGRLELRGLSLRGEDDLFGLDRLAVEGVVIDPATHLVRVGELSVEGPRLALGRDPSQRFFALGLRTLGLDAAAVAEATAAKTAPRAAVTDPAPAPVRAPVRLELGRLRWGGTRVTLVDALQRDGAPLLVDALELDLEGLVLDLDPAANEPAPARLSGRIAAGGVVDALEVTGTIRTRPGRPDLTAELALRGRGLRASALAGYLRPLGVEPALVDGALALDLRARLAQGADLGWVADLRMTDLRLEDGGVERFALERLEASGVELSDVVRVARLELAGLRAEAGRDASGTFVLPGLRVVAPTRAQQPPIETAGAAVLPRLPWPELPALELASVDVGDVRLRWRDESLAPPLETGLELRLQAGGVGTLGSAGTFQAELALDDTLERLTAAGELTLGPHGAGLALALQAEGLREGPLARLLPAGVELAREPGRLSAALEIEARPTEAEGLALRAAARDVSCSTHDADEPWLALSGAALEVALEPATDTLRIREATLRGLTLEARRDEEGALHALGLRLSPGVQAEAAPARDDAAAPAPPPPPLRALPRVVLEGDISFDLSRARLRDDVLGAGAAPLEIASALRVTTPAIVVSPRLEELDPLSCALEVSVGDVLESFTVLARATPFAAEPAFEAAVAARGLDTAALVARLPALAARARGTLEQGTFDARLRGTLDLRRVGPTDPGFARPFSAHVEVWDADLRETFHGRRLAGVQRVSADVHSIDLAHGLVHVAELEIERPHARIARGEDGALHALGLALALAAPAGESAPAPPRAPAAPAARERSADGEWRVDRLHVSGLDMLLEDLAVDPPMAIPLVALDAEIAGLSTRLADAPGSVRFDVQLGAGPGARGASEPVFEELAASGRLSLHPRPSGRAQISLSGLALREFAGLARALGLELEDGALDARTRLRLDEQGALRVDTALVFGELDLSEPSGGWLERTLSLPVALDTALFLLRNPDGELRFSTGVTLDAQGVSAAQIAGAAGRAFAEVLAGALAGAPLRLLGTVMPLGDGAPPPEASWEFAFAAGASELEPAARHVLDEVARRLSAQPRTTAVLSCELSAADLERARVLANPSPRELRAWIDDLRRRRAELGREHARALAQARACGALGGFAGAAETLRALSGERAEVERSLDALLEILRSDQPRRSERRARSALREIGELRVESLRRELELRLDPSARRRLETRAVRAQEHVGLDHGRMRVEFREH
jgi:hypothetical protein